MVNYVILYDVVGDADVREDVARGEEYEEKR